MDEDRVILVDEADRAIGVAGKTEAHQRALLHRAFSVFLVNEDGQLLLQRRAAGKYHSAGLWGNACCGHPRPGEETGDAAARRVREELGVPEPDDLREVGIFLYRADVGNGLVEHELDHVFLGTVRETPAPDPREIAELRWMEPAELRRELSAGPSAYAAWLPEALGLLATHSR